MSHLDLVMRAIRSMPPLPQVALRVLHIVQDPEYSTDALVAVVRTDPTLTAKILKLSNSSLFGLSHEITNVSDAVAYLGMRNLVKLVLVSCTGSYFRNVDRGYFASPGEIWRHSVACALACQMLAERGDRVNPATAFTAGILHNVGKVALAQVLEAEGESVLQAAAGGADEDFLAFERRVAGMDHATAGGLVTDNWSLPVDLRRAVRNHHDPAMLQDEGDLTSLVHVADIVVLQLGVGAGIDGLNYPLSRIALDKLRLTEADLDSLRLRVTEELRRSEDLLNVDRSGSR